MLNVTVLTTFWTIRFREYIIKFIFLKNIFNFFMLFRRKRWESFEGDRSSKPNQKPNIVNE